MTSPETHCQCCGQPLPINIIVEPGNRLARLGARTIPLVGKELELMTILVGAKGNYRHKDNVIAGLWINMGQDEPDSSYNYLCQLIRRLRKKLPYLGLTIEMRYSKGIRIVSLEEKRGFSATTVRPEIAYTQISS